MGGLRGVPAAGLIPAARVVLYIIEPKTPVAGSVNPWVNRAAQLFEVRGDCRTRDWERSEVLLGSHYFLLFLPSLSLSTLFLLLVVFLSLSLCPVTVT
jgi:hypothetical protein